MGFYEFLLVITKTINEEEYNKFVCHCKSMVTHAFALAVYR